MQDDKFSTIDITLDSFNDVSAANQVQYAGPDTINIQPPGLEKVIGFCLLKVRIPFSYYVINEINNRFILTVGDIPYTIEIPPGTYDMINLPITLSSSLQTAEVPNYTNFNFFISTIDMTFNVWNAIDSFSISFKNVLINNKIGSNDQLAGILGFYADTVYSRSINSQVSKTVGDMTDNLYFRDTSGNLLQNVNYIKSGEVVNLLGEQEIRVLSQNLNPSKYSAAGGSDGKSNEIAILDVNTNFGGIIEYIPKRTFVKIDSEKPVNQVVFGLKFGDFRQNGFKDISGNTNFSEYISLRGNSWRIWIRFYFENDQAISNN